MNKDDKRKQRIEELRSLQRSEFVLRDKMDFSEIDIEDWSDAMAAYDFDVEKSANLARLRRLAVTVAYQSGWFTTAPDGLIDDDFKLMRPALISALGNDVLVLFNEVVAPDASFT